ncbi:xylosidase : arabinofuranosidase protein [Venturia nashicola]|nr:xylosidase : arabinofuranosidase protein [Venturia nashicola]
MLSRLSKLLHALLPSIAVASSITRNYDSSNSTINNPILPGWHSDPSCILVPEFDDTFFCVTSSFIASPGLPIYASKDLANWKLVSHALNRPSQLSFSPEGIIQNEGIFAATIRYREGVLYVITTNLHIGDTTELEGVLFSTTDPYSNAAWSSPVRFATPGIDVDLFWDDNGTAYVAHTAIGLMTLNTTTGATSDSVSIWNGTEQYSKPEGPHIYRKDGYYYLMIAEGGTETKHSAVIARSKKIYGPYENDTANPLVTARDTPNYFQTVGHADLFQDKAGNWWMVALSTRSGPEWVNYPMGRETVLTPVTWNEGKFPEVDPVFGKQSGWPIKIQSRDAISQGSGPWIGDPDVINFEPGSSIPPHFIFWRWPVQASYEISPPNHPNSLRLKPSKDFSSTPENPAGGAANGITLITRLQEHTLFNFSIDVDFQPQAINAEAGIIAFLTQSQHIDLGIILMQNSSGLAAPYLRLSVLDDKSINSSFSAKIAPGIASPIFAPGKFIGTLNAFVPMRLSPEWAKHPIKLEIQARNDTHFTFLASSRVAKEEPVVFGELPTSILSGGSGPFTGTLLGAYATTNGGNVTSDYAYVSKWRYTGVGQKIDNDVIVPTT